LLPRVLPAGSLRLVLRLVKCVKFPDHLLSYQATR
jgi:hypothetical protein